MPIFQNKKESKVTSAKVISKINDTLVLAEDSRGRRFRVESDGSYTVGQPVRIKDGVTVSKIKGTKKIKHFQV